MTIDEFEAAIGEPASKISFYLADRSWHELEARTGINGEAFDRIRQLIETDNNQPV